VDVGPNGNNLHRNIIFRDGKDLADQVVPFSAYDSEDPEDLWAGWPAYEADRRQLLAIPHNGNLSNGLMFDDVTTLSGEPLDRLRRAPDALGAGLRGHPDQGRRRSPSDAVAEDEFADYGTWDKGSFGPSPRRPRCCRANTRGGAGKRGSPTRPTSASTRSSSA
jgi:hypothetical protein